MNDSGELEKRLVEIFTPSEVAAFLKVNSWLEKARQIVNLVDSDKKKIKKQKKAEKKKLGPLYVQTNESTFDEETPVQEDPNESVADYFATLQSCIAGFDLSDPLDAKAVRSLAARALSHLGTSTLLNEVVPIPEDDEDEAPVTALDVTMPNQRDLSLMRTIDLIEDVA